MRFSRLIPALALVLAVWPSAPAHAFVRVGIGIGVPFPGYYYPPPYYYGYYPPPVVVAPSPVVIAAPGAAPAPAVVQPAYPPAQTAPPPLAPVPMPEQLKVPPQNITPTMALEPTPDQKAAIDRWYQQLSNADDRARADACVALGRLRATQVVIALSSVLANDRSPLVREAAARGLGLIGSSAALTALQTAAQADDDRDVRSSARFAVDVIRSRP